MDMQTDSRMDTETESHRRRLTPFQRVAVAFAGLMLIVTGLATLVEEQLHDAYFPVGVVFAPFALAGGVLLIVLAIKAGRRE
jgi:cytochrome bd-type quinol oxidase subunit 2